MSRVFLGSVVLAVLVLSWATLPSAGAPSDDVTEGSQSDFRVAVTLALRSGGLDLSFAHEVALLATDGVLLEDETQVCTVYLVTLHWCEEQEDGSSASMMMHFRMDESCFDSFFPLSGICLGMECPSDSQKMYRMTTGNMYCFGIPQNTCVFATFSGPVQSTCDSLPSCACLPELSEGTCGSMAECVPVVPTVHPDLVVPSECPECD